MFHRLILAAMIVATQTAALVAGPIRGRSFDVTAQLVKRADLTDTTTGTVTVKISKDGGAQATATNAASHLGTGQWKVTLTPAEMDAASVGVQFAEASSGTVNLNLVTEQPLPFNRWVARYDGSLGGNLLTTFSRNAATVDGIGTTIGANVPRFLQSNRSVSSLLDYRATGIALINTSQLLSGGYDLDGDSILCACDVAGATVKFIEVKPSGAAGIISTTAATALPGAGGGIVYTIRGARVIFGTTIVHAQRTNSGIVEGITLFVTQNNGATWTRVENSAIDGGGFGLPKPAAYGTNADNIPRGREWATTFFPEGGLDAAGNFNPNDIWFTWVDYLAAGGALPKGGQCGIVRLTRDAADEHFTIGKARVLDERWEPNAAANFHYHTLGLTGRGLFVLGNGDVERLHGLHTFELDHDAYETAPITETNDWFGEVVPTALLGRSCPQISMLFPGRAGVILGSNDTWQSPVLQIGNVAHGTEDCDLSSPITIQSDANAGSFYRGWANIWAQWNPGQGGHGGDYVVGGLNAQPDVTRHYSEDGLNWASLNNCDTFENQHVLCGDFIAIIRQSDEMLMLARKPSVQTVNPLMLAPGADNLLTSAAPDPGAATAGGNTRQLVNWTNGRFVFATGGADVPNAPKVPAPFPNPVYVYLGCESTTSNAHGSIFSQASGQTINTGANYLAGTFAIAPLGQKAVGKFTARVGTAGAIADSTAELGPLVDRSKGHWSPFAICDNPVNNPVAARGTVTLNAGPTASLANDECPMLIAIGGVYLSQLVTPWPCARLSTSNPNEYAEVILPQTYSNNWTASGLLIRSEEGATVTGAAASGPLATLWKDASNYVSVYFDGANFEVEVTATVAGVAGTTQVIAIEDWPRDFGLAFCAADNGTDVLFSVLTPRNGVQTATLSSGSLKGPPTRLRWSDAAQTAVYNYYVAGCEFQDRSLTLSQQFDALSTLNFLSTDAQLASQEAIDALDALETQQEDQHAATMNRLGVPTTTNLADDIDTRASAEALADVALDVDTANGALVDMDLLLDNMNIVIDALPTANENRDATLGALLAGYTTAGTLGKVIADIFVDTGTDLPAAIEGIEGGGGGTVIPVNQVPIPASRTWKLSTELAGDGVRTLPIGTPQVFAIDYVNDLAANGRVVGIDSVAIATVDGAPAAEGEAGVTWDLADVADAGVDRSTAKLRLTGVEAGAYELDVTVDYGDQDGGGQARGRVRLTVTP